MVGFVLAQDLAQVGLVPDEGSVQELAPASADPALGYRVHLGVRMLQSTARIPASARTTSNAAVPDEPTGAPAGRCAPTGLAG
jgi:hypothetical protein